MGKYVYERKGLLDKISNIRPVRSVIIVSNEDAAKVITLLEKYNAKVKSYSVELEEEILS